MAGTPDVVPETRATPAAPVPSSSKSSLSLVGRRSIGALKSHRRVAPQAGQPLAFDPHEALHRAGEPPTS